jgi:RNA polymerase sigma-70 factor (ECF subfamily)
MPVESPDTTAGTAPAVDVEAVWVEFRERLRAFVARRIASPSDVDDIVQRVFLQMHRRRGQIRSRERVHAWLYSTARRAVADHYRAGSQRREVPAGDAFDLDSLTSAPHAAPDAEGAAEVAACLAPVVDRLSPADREAIVLTELRGLRLAEAAMATGISLSGMKSRVQRARRRFREMVLACCDVALDGRGKPLACEERGATAGPCCAGTRKEA